MKGRVTILSAALLVAGLVSLQAGGSAQQAVEFERKLLQIADHGSTTNRPPPRRTPISENEVNAWFSVRGGDLLPEGVAAPALRMNGSNRVTGTAVVDLDAIAKTRTSGGLFDPWAYLGGRVPVAVTGVVHTRDGRGRFELQQAEISGVPVPRAVIQEVVAYYTRSSDHPRGLRLDDEFALPAKIQHLEVGRAQMVVVQ